MMRRVLCILLSVFFGLSLNAQTGNTDGVYAVLDSLMLNYVGSIQQESQESKQNECGFLINSVKDSLLKQQPSK